MVPGVRTSPAALWAAASTYLALAGTNLRRQLTYRAANLAGLITNLFFGALRAYVLIALFGAREQVAGYSVRDAVTYSGITQALMSCVAIFGWWDMIRSIRTGEVATDLSRPVDYFWYWCALDFGRGVGQLALRGLPLVALYVLAYRITSPPTLWHWLALPISLLLGLFVSFAWRFLVSLTGFWTRDATGIGRLAFMLAYFFSGLLMPLAFFPDWAASLLRLTPFSAMMYLPSEVYLGVVRGPGLAAALAVQALWAVALYALARVVLAAGVRHLVLQGG